jgi:hypothetical protein
MKAKPPYLQPNGVVLTIATAGSAIRLFRRVTLKMAVMQKLAAGRILFHIGAQLLRRKPVVTKEHRTFTRFWGIVGAQIQLRFHLPARSSRLITDSMQLSNGAGIVPLTA